MDKQFTYSEPTKEEGEAFNLDLQAVIAKHSIVLVPIPVINYKEGNRLESQINLMKKVELVPKENGVPSPYENAGNDTETTENGEETPGTNEKA